jgi:hypothetical protein
VTHMYSYHTLIAALTQVSKELHPPWRLGSRRCATEYRRACAVNPQDKGENR